MSPAFLMETHEPNGNPADSVSQASAAEPQAGLLGDPRPGRRERAVLRSDIRPASQARRGAVTGCLGATAQV